MTGRAVAGCVALLDGDAEDAEDAELIIALGGPPARWVVTGGPSGPPYLLRVWALLSVADLKGDPVAGVLAAASRVLTRLAQQGP